MSFQPTQIFEEGTTEEKGENARLAAFVGAIAVGDLVKSTLGPKGMDKILQSASTAEIMVTNDGATILKSIALDNAAAKVLVNISKVQDDEVGDGTTSVAVLAAELLREAEKLVDKKIHPQTIIEGYRIASQAALKALEGSAVDHSKNPEAFRKDLLAIARTTLSSKVLAQDRDQFAELAVDAVLRLKTTDLNHIQIIKKAGGKLSDSYLDEGFILDKKIGVNQPKRLEKAKILVANTSMDTDKVKIFGARVKVGSTSKLAELEKAEKDKMKAKVEKIKAHGINCFINRQLIYNWPEQLFTDAGIMSIEHADFDGIERLALVTGGEIASTFDHPDQVKLGHCDVIEEVIIGEDTLIKFSGVSAGEACTIVLRGATEQLLDEAERSLHDALAVLSQTVVEPRTTLGGGCAEMLMAKAVEGAATRVEGKRQLAVSSFAIALRQLPTILADNAGLDSGDLVARLRKALYDGLTTYGLDLATPGGGITDMRELGVIESYKLKKAVVSSASEAAELLLRVDDIIRAAPRRRERLRSTLFVIIRNKRTCSFTSPRFALVFASVRLRSPKVVSSQLINSEVTTRMEQAKISDFFSSSPSSRLSSQRSKKRHNIPSTAPPNIGAEHMQSNPFNQSLQQPQHPQSAMPKPTRKPKRSGLPTSSQLPPRAASSLPSIPSTPISEAKSSQASKKRQAEDRNERVSETPPRAHKRPALGSLEQHTPNRMSQLAQASSPYTPFDISSAESSDSDCQIQQVQPSPNPKRKLAAVNSRARPTKKAKIEQQPPTQRGYASIKASVLTANTASAGQKKPVARQRQAASVPPSAPLPELTLSSSGPNRRSSVPPKRIPAQAKKPTHKNATRQQSTAPESDDESDCIIEKVLPSPKRRLQLEQQKANVKRRRVGDSFEASISVDAGQADSQDDSDCELVKVLPSPKRRGAAMPTASDSDADDEKSQTQSQPRRKLAIPRKPQPRSVGKRTTPATTPATSVAARSPTPSRAMQSPHIDLTQEPSSDSSDFSDDETITTTAQAPLPAPVQNASVVQSDQALNAGRPASSNTVKPTQPPKKSPQAQEQPRSSSENITDKLMAFLDDRSEALEKEKQASSAYSESPASSNGDVPFSTAPEYPYDDSAAKKIKLESHDYGMRSIKQESSLGQHNSDSDEDNSDDTSVDGGILPIKQGSSSRYASSSDGDSEEASQDKDLKSVKLESGSSSRIPSAVKHYEPSHDYDSEEEYQGLPDLSDDEVHIFEDEDPENAGLLPESGVVSAPGAAKPESVTSTPMSYESSSDDTEGFRSSPPIPYKLPLGKISSKATNLASDDGTENETVMEGFNDLPGSMKTHPANSVSNVQERFALYELQPVYSGEKLVESHPHGTPPSFRPHHRESLIGLKSILKGSGSKPGRDSDDETVYSPFPDISPLSGDDYIISSPSERVQHSKVDAKVIRPSERRVS
ncbi:hypothetical protein ACHAPJ_011242 [Fusarium lateritium]